MSNVLDTALTGVRAFLTKLDITADNIANVNTEDFKKSRAELQETNPHGVTVSVTRIDTPGMPLPVDEYTSTAAEASNVVLEEEFVDVIATRHMYTANLKTIETEEEMKKSLLDIFA